MTLKLETWQKYSLLPIAFAIYFLMTFIASAYETPTDCINPLYYSGDFSSGNYVVYCGSSNPLLIDENGLFLNATSYHEFANGSFISTAEILIEDWSYEDISLFPFRFSDDSLVSSSNFSFPQNSSSTLIEYTGFFSGVKAQVISILTVLMPFSMYIFALFLGILYAKVCFHKYSATELDNADKWDYQAYQQGIKELGFKNEDEAMEHGIENMSDVNWMRHDDGRYDDRI